jgi:hypothetical protein
VWALEDLQGVEGSARRGGKRRSSSAGQGTNIHSLLAAAMVTPGLYLVVLALMHTTVWYVVVSLLRW